MTYDFAIKEYLQLHKDKKKNDPQNGDTLVTLMPCCRSSPGLPVQLSLELFPPSKPVHHEDLSHQEA